MELSLKQAMSNALDLERELNKKKEFLLEGLGEKNEGGKEPFDFSQFLIDYELASEKKAEYNTVIEEALSKLTTSGVKINDLFINYNANQDMLEILDFFLSKKEKNCAQDVQAEIVTRNLLKLEIEKTFDIIDDLVSNTFVLIED